MHMHVTTAEGREIIFPKADNVDEQFQAMRMDHLPESIPVVHHIRPMKIGLWDQSLTNKLAMVEWK